MDKNQLAILLRAAKAAGQDPTKLQAKNPYTLQGPVAELMQASVAQIDAEQAQRWSEEAGAGLSLATLAYQQGLGEMTPSIFNELALNRPADVAAAREQAIEDQLRGFEEAAAALAARNAAGPSAEQVELERIAREDSMRRGREQMVAQAKRRGVTV